MPEPVSQALKTLAANPTIGTDITPSSLAVSTPEPKAISTPDQAQETSQTQIKPIAESKPESASIPSEAAITAPALTATAPESKGPIPPQGQDDQVEQAECSTCGGYHGSSGGGAFHARMGCATGLASRAGNLVVLRKNVTRSSAPFLEHVSGTLLSGSVLPAQVGTRGFCFVLCRLRSAPDSDPNPLRQS